MWTNVDGIPIKIHKNMFISGNKFYNCYSYLQSIQHSSCWWPGIFVRYQDIFNHHINVGKACEQQPGSDKLIYPSSHYSDVIMSAVASQFTGVSMVCSAICSGADQRKHQSSASLAFVRGIHQWPMNSPHEGPVTRKMFPFDNVIMQAVPRRNYCEFKAHYYFQTSTKQCSFDFLQFEGSIICSST